MIISGHVQGFPLAPDLKQNWEVDGMSCSAVREIPELSLWEDIHILHS